MTIEEFVLKHNDKTITISYDTDLAGFRLVLRWTKGSAKLCMTRIISMVQFSEAKYPWLCLQYELESIDRVITHENRSSKSS